MAKEIIRINQKRTNAFTLSPMAFALAACGGGGDSGEVASAEPVLTPVNWPYPSIIEDITPYLNSTKTQNGIYFEGSTFEDGKVTIPEGVIDMYTPDGGSAVITWFRDGEPQPTANEFEYEFTQADVGAIISVEALFYDGADQLDLIAVNSFDILNRNDEPAGDVSVSGEMMLGETLVSDISRITDEDGLGTFSYQWQRGGRDIDGATNASYTITDIDVGNTISLDVSYIDAYGTQETLSFDSDIIVSLVLPFKTVVPAVSAVVGETQWAETWYTGSAELAVDGNRITSWTYEGLGQITFDLGKDYNIGSVFIVFDGSVSNGNSINLYVDDVLVSSGVQPASAKTWDIEDTVGRYVTYETVAEPHNEYLQVATWSEISEFNVIAQEIIA